MPLQQTEWLRHSKYWEGLELNAWRSRKVLGAGSFGVCGLWERISEGEDLPRFVVVKQNIRKGDARVGMM